MKVRRLWFSDERIFIETTKGEVLSQLLRFYPRLAAASGEQRSQWEQSYGGIHWQIINEDISFDSFRWADDDPLRLYPKGA